MEYNIEKINEIGKLLAEVVEEAMEPQGQVGVLIGDIEMAMRESLLKIGNKALQCLLENADGETEAEMECACGGTLQYQRRREATIWSVFGKVR